jgi:predicted nucleic acid-binding protein
MAERWVLNASPLIVLSKINHHHLLFQLADEIVIPAAVPVLQALQAQGFRLDDQVVRDALHQVVGERWESSPDEGT